MTDTRFDRFIKFGSAALSNEDTGNFAPVIEKILSNKTIRKLYVKDSFLAEHITTEILKFINETKRNIQGMEKFNFVDERKLLDIFRQADKDSFETLWEVTTPFIQKTYEPQIIDTEFYYGEFQKSLFPPKNDKNSISFQSIKEYFTGKWEDLLIKKTKQSFTAFSSVTVGTKTQLKNLTVIGCMIDLTVIAYYSWVKKLRTIKVIQSLKNPQP